MLPPMRSKQPLPTFETYIQRKLVAWLMAASGLAVLLSALGVGICWRWCGASSVLSISQGVGLALIIFLVEAGAGGWLMFRALRPSLAALGHLEWALQAAAQGEPLQPIPNPGRDGRMTAIEHDYNTLVECLAARDAARLEFLGQVTHELRSPLASIFGYASVLLDTRYPPTAAESEQYTQIILTQTQRIIAFADNLVLVTQIQFDCLDLVPVPIHFDRFIIDLVKEIEIQSRRPITVSLDSGPVNVRGDPLRLRQAVLSLVENAVKFSPADAPVSATLRRSASGQQVELAVADRGPGIAQDDLPKLFRPFGRLRLAQGGQIRGSGLGLYIAHAIVQHHAGSIQVDSELGAGSVFTMRLPLTTGEVG